ncbi:MAG: ABC transporter ATP-binding protein [Hyphomicrobiales bacterium]|nr:ABC transporter ATP-binding protein [Hyphomicrobiales bacterium]MCP4997610.1 ABC transporter ATP-binding protein [Hyphomicrobiales bacterium]
MEVQNAAHRDANQVSVRLGAEELSKRYGNIEANRDVSIAVAPGEIHAIVGENGAGKSTLMRMLQGIEQPDSGRIIVDDQIVSLSGPQRAFALGIGMVHQEFMLAPDLTLLENLVLGDEPVYRAFGAASRINWPAALESGERLAREAAAHVDWSRTVLTTPVHIQQFVEIIRLLRRGTRILILDEPTAVLAPQQVEDLFDLLRKLREDGTTILFISHKLKEVMALADRVTVIRRGEVRYSSPVAETDTDTIAGHMVGGLDTPVATARPTSASKIETDDVVLDVQMLTTPIVEKSHPLRGVDLHIGRGEIVGLAGVSGNGQNELVECLVGLRDSDGGTVSLAGQDITHLSNQHRRALGIGYVSADRRHEGLALQASVEANVIAGSQRKAPVSKGGFFDRKAMRQVAEKRLAFVDVRYGVLNDAAGDLSGGNQQRLVFAREIAADPSLLIVSQPTRGVDLVGIAAIHAILSDFRNSGGSVLLVSEELDEILALSDRILVMADGKIVGEMNAAEADIGTIGKLMVMQGGGDG